MKGAVSFLISAMNHSPKGRQKTDSGVGLRSRAAMGEGTRSLNGVTRGCVEWEVEGSRAALKGGVGG